MNNSLEVTALIDKPIENEDALQNELSDIEAFAMSIKVNDDQDYSKAVEFGRLVKEKSAQVKEFFAPMKKTAHDAHKQICDREKTMLQPLVNTEKILKTQLRDFVMKKEQERARQEEEARRLALQEAQRIEAVVQEAEQLGDIERATEASIELSVVNGYAESLVVETSVPTSKNASHSKTWEIVALDPEKVPVSVAGIELRPVDEAAVLRLIKATKGQIKIDGVEYKETVQISIRR